MAVTKDAVEKIIFNGLNLLNDELGPDKKISVSDKTPLFGVDAEIDSLSLVSLIVDIETSLNSDFDLSISLTDDRAMTRSESPFLRVETLRNYILELVSEG